MSNSVSNDAGNTWKRSPKEKNINSISLKSRISWIILWILLSLWVYEWTTKSVQVHQYNDFISSEQNLKELLESKFSEYLKQKYEYFKQTWSILSKMIEENFKSWNFDILLKDLWFIIESSEDSILEVVITDLQGNIIYDLDYMNQVLTTCKSNWKIEDSYYFSLNDLTSFQQNQSFITGIHNHQSECSSCSHDIPSLAAIRKINLNNWKQGFLIVKYKISFFQEFISQNSSINHPINITISNNIWDILYKHNVIAEWSEELDQNMNYKLKDFISVANEPYIISISANKQNIDHEIESNQLSWIIWLLFLLVYTGLFTYSIKNKENIIELLKKKSFEIWNTKLKAWEYAKILEDILESSPYPIFIKDLNWRYILWNNLFLTFSNLESQEHLINNHVSSKDICSDPDEILLHQEKDNLLIREWFVEPYEIKRHYTNWSEKIYRVKKGLFKKENWEIWWIICILIDITDLKEVTEEAENISRSKSDLLANMSHELRTPLNSIIWFSDIMQQEIFWPIWPRYKGYAQDIHNSWEHLLQLIEDILDLSRIELWSIELKKTEVNFRKLVEQSLSFIKVKCQKKNISVNLDISDKIIFTADRLRIKQVIINLLWNAIKYTPEGWKIIVKATKKDDFHVKIEIIDNGIWMDRHEISKVLEPFYQADTVHNQQNKGTGLGLRITNSIIHLHWWKLEIESEKWKWTSMIVILPTEFDSTFFIS